MIPEAGTGLATGQDGIQLLIEPGALHRAPGCFFAHGLAAQAPGFAGAGWDHRDPVNIAEARTYPRLFYEFEESGVVSEGFVAFRFTNAAPTGTITPFFGAEEFFRRLYAHRLNYGECEPEYHTLADLLRDDPSVEAAFRL